MDQMIQPTVSEHRRKLVPKDQTAIPSGPTHRAHNNTTTMPCETKTKYKHKSTHSEMGPVWRNLVHRTVRTAHICVRTVVHNCRTQHSTEQFWLSSLLTSRQASQIRYCLLEGRGLQCSQMWHKHLRWSILHNYVIQCMRQLLVSHYLYDWCTMNDGLQVREWVRVCHLPLLWNNKMHKCDSSTQYKTQ